MKIKDLKKGTQFTDVRGNIYTRDAYIKDDPDLGTMAADSTGRIVPFCSSAEVTRLGDSDSSEMTRLRAIFSTEAK